MTFLNNLLRHVQFVWTVDRLRDPVALAQVCGHLERIYVGVRLLAEGDQLPQRHPEGPLQDMKCSVELAHSKEETVCIHTTKCTFKRKDWTIRTQIHFKLLSFHFLFYRRVRIPHTHSMRQTASFTTVQMCAQSSPLHWRRRTFGL